MNSSGSAATDETRRREGIVTRRIACDRARPGIDVHVVRDAAGVVEQVPKTDPSSLAQATWKELAHAVVEPQLALGHEQHGDRCHEALGHAPDPEAIVRPGGSPSDDRVAGRDDGALTVPFDERDHCRDLARCDEAIGRLPERNVRRRGRLDQRDGERGADEQPAGDDEEWYEPHVVSTPRAGASLRRYASSTRRV